MAGIPIVTDSSCDLPANVADEHGITIVPLTIRFGEEELVDRRDLTPAQFWERCAASTVLPETAAPSPGSFEEAFRAAAAGGGAAGASGGGAAGPTAGGGAAGAAAGASAGPAA